MRYEAIDSTRRSYCSVVSPVLLLNIQQQKKWPAAAGHFRPVQLGSFTVWRVLVLGQRVYGPHLILDH